MSHDRIDKDGWGPAVRRDPSFIDLDVFQAEVKEWAYRNFGSPDDGRTIRLERLFSVVRGFAQGDRVLLDPSSESSEEVQALALLYALAQSVEEAPPDAPSYRPLLGACEELGELAHAHLKGEQGIRHTPEEIADKKRDAVGDVLVYLADYCNREGVEMSACLERAWGEVKQRDWAKQTGMDKQTEGS